jgi:hypothetical protein
MKQLYLMIAEGLILLDTGTNTVAVLVILVQQSLPKGR